MKKLMTRDEVLALMKKQQGKRTAQDYAVELGISKVYLSDIYAGKKDPGEKVLVALGMARVVMYKRAA